MISNHCEMSAKSLGGASGHVNNGSRSYGIIMPSHHVVGCFRVHGWLSVFVFFHLFMHKPYALPEVREPLQSWSHLISDGEG